MATLKGCITSIEYNPLTGDASRFDVDGTEFAITGKLGPAIEKASDGCFEVEVTYDEHAQRPWAVSKFKRLKKNKKCCEEA
jgi:hypothetical protein